MKLIITFPLSFLLFYFLSFFSGLILFFFLVSLILYQSLDWVWSRLGNLFSRCSFILIMDIRYTFHQQKTAKEFSLGGVFSPLTPFLLPNYVHAPSSKPPQLFTTNVNFISILLSPFIGTTTRTSEIAALRLHVTRAIQHPLSASLPAWRSALRNEVLSACAEFLETSDTHAFVFLTRITSAG